MTLYGIVDTGIGYQSSSTTLGSTSGGHSAFRMITGVWAGSRFGLKGAEDLGGGTKAIFMLEEGFTSANGSMSTTNLMFSRQAFVGVTNPTYGSLTAGRQYASYYQLVSPYSPTTWLTGFLTSAEHIMQIGEPQRLSLGPWHDRQPATNGAADGLQTNIQVAVISHA
ncbi:putative porin [Paraburkholderia sp. WC7.3d]